MIQTLNLTCSDCWKTVQFTGSNIDEIIKQIDKAGWHDYPGGAYCPDCDKIHDEEE